MYNLYALFADRNLKFGNKLEFVSAAGIISSRSLIRLNTIRNKMEHQFEKPKIQEIEVYYDLVLMFVAVLQAATMCSERRELKLVIREEQENQSPRIGLFYIQYDFEAPSIKASWQVREIEQTLLCDMTELTEFAFFFKMLLLLEKLESFASHRYIASQLTSDEDFQRARHNALR